MQAWRHDMAALAAQPQVACKLSGLLTEMAKPDLQSEERILDRLFPVVDVLPPLLALADPPVAALVNI